MSWTGYGVHHIDEILNLLKERTLMVSVVGLRLGGQVKDLEIFKFLTQQARLSNYSQVKMVLIRKYYKIIILII